MNVQPSPTSPKARMGRKAEALGSLYKDSKQQSFTRPPQPSVASLRTVVISVAISVLAGMIGGLLYEVYLTEPVVSDSTTPAIKRSREKTAVFSESETRKILLAIFPARSTEMSVYAEDEQLGTALLLSSDGWAVASSNIVSDESVAVTFDQKIFRIEERIVDPATDLTYFQIGGSRHAIATFDTPDFSLGEQFHSVAASISDETAPTRTVSVERLRARSIPEGAEEESDALGRVVALADDLPKSFLGSAVVNDNGKVVGVIRSVDGSATFWPSSVVTAILDMVLSQQTIIRSSLALRYIDLALTPGISEQQRLNRFQGAFVTAKTPTTANKSIQVGDILVAVGEHTLNSRLGLHEALQAVQPDSVVSMTLIRNGTEQKIPITPDANTGTP